MASLYATAAVGAYGVGDDARLEADLAAAATTTAAWDPPRWEAIKMAPDGSLPCGARYTQSGLASVCDELAPGLFRLLLDLAGDGDGGDGAAAGETSLAEAAALYNLILRRRFETRLRDRRSLVRDLAAGTIDGVLPVGAPLATNGEFFAMVREELARFGRRAVLAEASLVGRRLALRYADRAGLSRAPDGEARHSGFFATSTEAAGEGAATAAAAVYSPVAGVWALGPPGSGRPPSRLAKGFRAAVEDVARAAVCAGVSRDDLASGLEALDARVAVPAGRGDVARVAMSMAVESLHRRGMPRRSAREVVLAARHGSPGDDLPEAADRPTFGEIRWLHLYKHTCSLAKSRHADLRERLERVAFSLVFKSKKREV